MVPNGNPSSDSTDDSPRDSTDDYGCPKCGHTDAEVGAISTTGGGLSKMFDIQTNRFNVVSCTNCGYSELYRDRGSGASDLVDVFLG
ncbi:MAG: zinc ribbon domain-containing protein [Haloferacaceae archaeon]